jgi:hypothetical protein
MAANGHWGFFFCNGSNSKNGTFMPSPTKQNPKFRFDRAKLKAAGKAVDRAGPAFFRWMTTDHTRSITALLDPPPSGILAGLRQNLKCTLLAVGITIVRTVLLVVLYVLWIPCLLWAIGWFLTH